jgi:hypothetical protein
MNITTDHYRKQSRINGRITKGMLRKLPRILCRWALELGLIFAFLWLAKCPGKLELWRPACMGFIWATIKGFR